MILNWIRGLFKLEKSPYDLLVDMSQTYINEATKSRALASEARIDARPFSAKEHEATAISYEKKAMEIIEKAEALRREAEVRYYAQYAGYRQPAVVGGKTSGENAPATRKIGF